MPTKGLEYPGVVPSVNGNQITLERFVKEPSKVYRVLSDLSKERFVSDFIFASGDAQGGAVLYDEIAANDLYASKDPSPIAPGEEFPLVEDTDKDPLTAAVTKRGAAFPLTYEAVRRDQRDVMQRGLIKLSNTSIRKHDSIAMTAIHGHPRIQRSAAAAAWSNVAADVFADMFTVQTAVEALDLGYIVDTAIAHPNEVLKLLKRKDVRDALPRENTSLNPIVSGRLAGLCGINNWIVTNRQTAGTVTFLQSKVAGSIRDEVPFYSRVVDQQDKERYLIMAGRVSVPIITDPLAVYDLTGL